MASPGVSPSSLRSKSICRPMHSPRNGLAAAASRTASPRPLSARHFMQSGMAPCPGKTTRSAARMASGSAVITTEAAGATWASAFCTERRLPIP